MIRVALYARVSSERQAQHDTIASQIAALQQRATADGCIVVPAEVYADDGFSGATLARPALERLRDCVAEGGVQRLYVDCPDRLARRYAYQVLLLEEFKVHGVEVVFLKSASGTSAEDTLLVQVQGMIAEYERARLAERCRRGKVHQAHQGKLNPLSAAPYGYRYVRRTETEPARYEVQLPEAEVVRGIFEAFVHRQMALHALALQLNDRHVPTRTGARWVAPTLHALLKNPAYMGQAAYGKTAKAEPQPRLRPLRPKSTSPKGRHGTSRRTPTSAWISIRVPPIVSAEIFAAAQEQFARNRHLAQRHAHRQVYLLQGLIVCACCGYAFCGRTVKDSKRGTTSYAYACRNLAASRGYTERRCANPSVRGEELDAQVWSSVCQVLEAPERLELEWRRRTEEDGTLADARAEQAQARRWVATQERALARLVDAYEAGALALEELTPRVHRVRDQLQQAHQRAHAADARVGETVDLRAVVGRLNAFAQRVRAGLKQLDWSERRQLICTLVARVELDDQKATVVYRLPPPGAAPEGQPPSSAEGAGICRLHLGRRDAEAQSPEKNSGFFLRLCASAPLRFFWGRALREPRRRYLPAGSSSGLERSEGRTSSFSSPLSHLSFTELVTGGSITFAG